MKHKKSDYDTKTKSREVIFHKITTIRAFTP